MPEPVDAAATVAEAALLTLSVEAADTPFSFKAEARERASAPVGLFKPIAAASFAILTAALLGRVEGSASSRSKSTRFGPPSVLKVLVGVSSPKRN